VPSNQRRIVVLGAGFGGLELATRLSASVADQVHVTLIDRSDAFVFGFAKLDVMFGHRRADEVRTAYRGISRPGVEFRQETVTSIDPSARRVTTDAGSYDADILVVALGADYDLAATPGLVEGGHEFYSMDGAERVRDLLPSFASGVAVVGVLGPVFKCPPAPYETALMLHDHLVSRGVRDAVEIHVVTQLPMPIPVSREVSEKILALLDERRIRHWPRTRVTRLDPASGTAHIADGQALGYDLFLAIPVHRAPRVVVESGLAEDDGWIAVDPATFATKFPDVYAVGDVASAPVPRAGVIAEGEAATLADVLIAQITGGQPPPAYEGGAVCYIEMGKGEVARVDVRFLSGDAPTAAFTPPSQHVAAQKREFAATRLARWFDQPGSAAI
jgi:sulfide:quinone oxidoreductase